MTRAWWCVLMMYGQKGATFPKYVTLILVYALQMSGRPQTGCKLQRKATTANEAVDILLQWLCWKDKPA